jgi:glycosyltransferase involved in cell wall biosynthesis
MGDPPGSGEARLIGTALVSVIIPVRNGERFIAEALSSVVAQSYPRIEVVVVDDGSDDGTADIVRRTPDPRIRYVRQEPGGAAAARNLGVRLACGAYLSFLDADDVWDADKLRLQIAAFSSHGPALDMVFGHVRPFHEASWPPAADADPAHPASPGYSSGTLLVRTPSFHRVGFFDSRWRVGEFIDWFMKSTEAGLSHLMLPDVVMRRRIHGDNMTRWMRQARSDYARIVAAAIERRRRHARGPLTSGA